MQSKIPTEKEFNDIWFRTGKDPNGEDMLEIMLGGGESSYNKYLLKNQIELKYYYQTELLYI